MNAAPLSVGLLVDDDATYLRALQRSLQRRGLTMFVAGNSAEALGVVRDQPIDFVLIDLKLGQESGLQLIAPVKRLRPHARVLLLTGYASVATAVEAIKRGADNYLLKPVSADTILRTLTEEDEVPLQEAEAESTMTPLSRLEWEHIQQALKATDGNISAAARLLGMHRRSLQRKLSKRPGPERHAPDSLD